MTGSEATGSHSQASLSCSVTQSEGLHSPGLGVLTEYCMVSKQCFQAEASYNTEVDESLIGLSCFVRCFGQMEIYMVMSIYIGLFNALLQARPVLSLCSAVDSFAQYG